MLAYTAGRVIVCCQLLYSGSRVAVHLTQARLYAVRWSMLLAYTASSGSRVAVHLTRARLLSTTLYAAGCCILVVTLL